ncbi:MAG: exopolyphosphatase [Deltaproteobacteria bacterium]|jgi:exopolyphosphatase/guanosine-5'-triphosphate,3'-diphosphate pyrophosphatase|nr:exopolyphosphatase [Deltaproteobacteria bacterium]MBW2535507.1 exopolyphosphatase [Deltaproteobacteria bacterium]
MNVESANRYAAAIDLGSNSFHMIVARVEGGTLHVADKERERVRLAAGLDEDRRITDDAQTRGLECLERFGQHVREMPHEWVRAVGTNTLRQARNGHEFLEKARAALGHPIEIIGGREEARLIYLGVAHTMAGSGERRLVIDIGGGSTECIVGQGFDVLEGDSLFMGCVSYSLRFFPEGEITKERFREARLAARLELESVTRRYRRLGWRGTAGCSGTVHAIDEIGRANGWSSEGITPKVLKKLRKALVAAGDAQTVRLAGLQDDRRPVIAGGVAILEACFESLQLERMLPSPGALREGVLYDLVGRLRHEDVRERTIRWFCERYGLDEERGAVIEDTALALLDQVSGSWELPGSWPARVLSWAARLFELGQTVSHTGYHKHGAYIVSHADMAGFSRDDQAALAALIRGHRRKLGAAQFASLSPRLVEQVQRLCLLFRLALCLQPSRTEEALAPVRCRAKRNRLTLELPDDLPSERPLTQAALEQEVLYWQAIGYELALA